jgi:hypothetical protein
MGSFVAFETMAFAPTTSPSGCPEWIRCGTWGCALTDRHAGLHLFDAPMTSRRCAAKRRKPRAVSTPPCAVTKPRCGTWGCRLPDRHPGLHDLGHLSPTAKRPRVVRPPTTPTTTPTTPTTKPPDRIRLGADYQATDLPDAGVCSSDDRGDVHVDPTECSMVDVFVAEAIAANAWRMRMSERYKLGGRDAGYSEEDALHAHYETRPETGARGALDPCDGERMDAELVALHEWRMTAFSVGSPCVA